MTPEQRRQVLAEIAREELKSLVYGEITCEADRVKLAELAAAAGVELAEVLPATGEPGHDPRTGVVNPCAHHEPEPEVVDDSAEAVVESDPDLDPDVVELVTEIDTRLQAVTVGEPVWVSDWGRMAIAEQVDRLAARTLLGAHRLVAVLEHHQIRAGALL